MTAVTAPRRRRPNLDGGRTPTNSELRRALAWVRANPAIRAISDALPHNSRWTVPIIAWCVAAHLNANHRDHRAHIADIARQLKALTPSQRRTIGMATDSGSNLYDRVWWTWSRLVSTLTSTTVTISNGCSLDPALFARHLVKGSVAPWILKRTTARAVDATDIETIARFVPKGTAHTGADGKAIWTKDPDARGGHRSAAGKRSAGEFMGYWAQPIVAIPEVTWTNGVDGIRFGPDVPLVATDLAVTAANAHPPDTVRPLLLDAKTTFDETITEIVADRGYTQAKPEDWHLPLRRAGIQTTADLKNNQRGPRSKHPLGVEVDGD